MKLIFETWLFCLLFFVAQAQTEVKNLYPKIGRKPDFTEAGQRGFERFIQLVELEIENEADSVALDSLGKIFEFTDDIWDVLPSGCSWYCGGGNYKVIASSALKQQGDNTYFAENANDLSLKTAWVEGSKEFGVEEYLEFYFKNDSPRLHTILIYNGYIKDSKTWKANSRVKKLKLTVNGVDFAILNLEDTTAEQGFDVGFLGHRPDGKDLILRFEIMEVYKGEKYKDTAITEIFFDGVDVH